MPFRDASQRAWACSILLAQLSSKHAEDWWSADGPTDTALALMRQYQRGERIQVSSGEMLLLRATLDFWNGTGHAHVHELLEVLEPHLYTAIGELIAALPKSESVKKWIAKWTPAPVPLVPFDP